MSTSLQSLLNGWHLWGLAVGILGLMVTSALIPLMYTTFTAQVRIRCEGSTIVRPVTIDAVDAYSAKLQLEALYGKNCIVNYPVPRR